MPIAEGIGVYNFGRSSARNWPKSAGTRLVHTHIRIPFDLYDVNALATPWTGEQKQAEATIRNRYKDLKNRLKLVL